MQLTIEDYDKWKANFEKNSGLRKTYGSRGAIAFTSSENSNEVTVIIKALNKQSMAKIRESGEFKQAMKDGGVVGEPNVTFLQYVKELDA